VIIFRRRAVQALPGPFSPAQHGGLFFLPLILIYFTIYNMVRVTLPLVSASAAGSIGNLITFQRTLRGVKAYKYNKHRDAQSSSQLSQRILYSITLNFWRAFTKTQKDYWSTRTGTTFLSGYHAFLSYILNKKPWPPPGLFTELDYMEYPSDAEAQAAYKE